jgi:hypothetical protein
MGSLNFFDQAAQFGNGFLVFCIMVICPFSASPFATQIFSIDELLKSTQDFSLLRTILA